MKYSLTIGGLVVAVAGTFLTQYFSQTCTDEIIKNAPLIVGAVIAYIGRIRQGDVNLLGFKKA